MQKWSAITSSAAGFDMGQPGGMQNARWERVMQAIWNFGWYGDKFAYEYLLRAFWSQAILLWALFWTLFIGRFSYNLQYCDYEIVHLYGERRYEPFEIAYVLSLSILIGASSEISGAGRTLQHFPRFSEFLKLFPKSFN